MNFMKALVDYYNLPEKEDDETVDTEEKGSAEDFAEWLDKCTDSEFTKTPE